MSHLYCSVIKSCNKYSNKFIANIEIIPRLIIRKRLRVSDYSEGLSAAIKTNEHNTQVNILSDCQIGEKFKKKVFMLSCSCHFSVIAIYHLVVPILGQCRHDIIERNAELSWNNNHSFFSMYVQWLYTLHGDFTDKNAKILNKQFQSEFTSETYTIILEKCHNIYIVPSFERHQPQ